MCRISIDLRTKKRTYSYCLTPSASSSTPTALTLHSSTSSLGRTGPIPQKAPSSPQLQLPSPLSSSQQHHKTAPPRSGVSFRKVVYVCVSSIYIPPPRSKQRKRATQWNSRVGSGMRSASSQEEEVVLRGKKPAAEKTLNKWCVGGRRRLFSCASQVCEAPEVLGSFPEERPHRKHMENTWHFPEWFPEPSTPDSLFGFF